ncbi:LysM peptidoglycan-binding domain-containing protein [Candidatus Sumerlaeota bacterium]
MMRTRAVSLLLCSALLSSLVLFSACSQSQQEADFVKQKFDELGNDLKVLKGQVAGLEMELEVLDERVEFLQKQKPAASGVDAAALQKVDEQLAQMAAGIEQVSTRVASAEKKIAARPKPAPPAPARAKTVTADIKAGSSLTKKAAAPAPRARGFYHTLKKGETLGQLAMANKVSEAKIRSANRIPSGRSPFAGQRIYVPGTK